MAGLAQHLGREVGDGAAERLRALIYFEHTFFTESKVGEHGVALVIDDHIVWL